MKTQSSETLKSKCVNVKNLKQPWFFNKSDQKKPDGSFNEHEESRGGMCTIL
jgi:hypothetical protein